MGGGAGDVGLLQPATRFSRPPTPGRKGRDLGGVIPIGVSITGEPAETTSLNSGDALSSEREPHGGSSHQRLFANGSGYTHYRWRLDGGAWSAEIPTATPITLTALANGLHFVEVVGKRDSAFPSRTIRPYGADAVITTSRTWTVNTSRSPLRLNEVLAANSGVLMHEGADAGRHRAPQRKQHPGESRRRAVDRRSLTSPDKFIFPAGASIPAGGYLTVFAGNAGGASGYHTGFPDLAGRSVTLSRECGVTRGVDNRLHHVRSPSQRTSPSAAARMARGSLTTPTFGAVNRGARLGSPTALRINEWLAIATAPFNNDFVELYNPTASTGRTRWIVLERRSSSGRKDRHEIPALSFMVGFGYQRLVADGDGGAGADHLNFSLER